MTTVLVTGGSGFIGRRILDILAQRPDRLVVAASRKPASILPAGVRNEAVDLLAPGEAARLIARVRPTHLLHLAWNATPGRFWAAADNLDWVAASASLLRAFLELGGTRAVLAGSCAEFDWTADGRLHEGSATRPATLYGAAKDAARRLAEAANSHLGASVAWGRVFWLYGPEEAPGRLVADVAAALARGMPVAVGEGRQMRDFLHVDDVAAAFAAALDGEWRGTFNIGSGQPTSVREIVGMLAAAAGRPDLIRFGARPTPLGEPPLLVASTEVLDREMGWKQAIPLEQGLLSTYAWWRERVLDGCSPTG
jgi:nucleoside-diphosphate-sugar epimerase